VSIVGKAGREKAGVAQATVIDGAAIAAGLRQRVAEVASYLNRERGVVPGLATVLVGDDRASQVYIGAKGRACAGSGLASFDIRLPADIPRRGLVREIDKLNEDEHVDGILVQLPLPRHLDPHRIVSSIDPGKDVDGFHPLNVGRLWSDLPTIVPCTPQACLRLLRSVHNDLTGHDAVVLGRSNIVGKPLAALLIGADCTVTVVHSKTRNAVEICRSADILIAAAGRPGIVNGAWVKPGATVVDVGISAVADPAGRSRVVGDVDFTSAGAVAGAITPVPGGVGPMTIACLLINTLLAACRRRGLPDPDV
jgi:methylenetetrahydrofolate dehydrogenase (NADP+)/methenyltetrahydrofolate cyclohydrolase